MSQNRWNKCCLLKGLPLWPLQTLLETFGGSEVAQFVELWPERYLALHRSTLQRVHVQHFHSFRLDAAHNFSNGTEWCLNFEGHSARKTLVRLWLSCLPSSSLQRARPSQTIYACSSFTRALVAFVYFLREQKDLRQPRRTQMCDE